MPQLIDFLKNNLFLQNLASWAYSKVPPMVEHNLQKYGALKKAMYLTALERLDGDYLEFGVFTGSSFVFAARMHKQLKFLGELETKFYGFDSFEGFGNISDHDKHPFYQNNTFGVNAKKIVANIKKKTKGLSVQIIPGYFEKTLSGQTASSLGIKKARVVFIDCDLKDPAVLALEFSKSLLQRGTILVMDDFFSYKANPTKGVAGAFNEFCKKYPGIAFRKLLDYGYGGVGYIISEIHPNSDD